MLFNGSRAALAPARAAYPGLVTLLVTAPPAVLAERLAGRGRESRDDIARRLERAGFDLPEGIAPIVVANDASPEEGIARFLAALQAERV